MALTDLEITEVLEAIEQHFSEQLSPWEFDFIADITTRWEKFHNLSDKQRAKLESIWDRFRTGGR